MTNTLDLIKKDKIMEAIVCKLIESDINILKAEPNEILAKAGCLPVYISWEMCSCHGGRMWLCQKETIINVELSSNEYDKEKGIVDPETELAYYIDNMMIEKINEFEKYVYVVDIIGEYDKDQIRTRYFKDIESASYFVFAENGHDLNNAFKEVLHQYPNPDIQLRVTYIGEKGEKLSYKMERLVCGEVEKEYQADFRIFRKS